MTFWTLIRRSLRFRARAHLGVVLGAAIGSAALIGALVVGDSVRQSLRERAVSRLGNIYFALSSGDRLFRGHLSYELMDVLSFDDRIRTNRLYKKRHTSAYDGLFSAPRSDALLLSGVAAKQDAKARANQVNVLGVRANWFALGSGAAALLKSSPRPTRGSPPDEVDAWLSGLPLEVFRRWQAGEIALVNEALARQLSVHEGDQIVLRIRRPAVLAQDAVISARNQDAVALRLRVGPIVPKDLLGDFSLSASQTTAENAFLPLGLLADKLRLFGANLGVCSLTEIPHQPNRWETWLLKNQWLSRRLPSRLVAPNYHEESLSPAASLEWWNEELEGSWQLEDAGLYVGFVKEPASATGVVYLRRCVEVSSSRIFLEPHTANAALTPRLRPLKGRGVDTTNEVAASQFVTNGVRVFTYLANLIRAGEHATPYSMVTATEGPYIPAGMGDDEILVNQWLAEDLHVGSEDSVALSYYVADSGSRLVERTNSFRVRAVVPMEGTYADRTLMPEFPGVAEAESTHDWKAGFPLVYKIRPKDEEYWKKYRGTPKAFITLAAGQKMWANRFGSLTAIRYEVPAGCSPAACWAAVYGNLLANLDPADLGLRFEPVRERALKAAEQGQDFGQLFLGFSLFLVVAALLLMALLFQFGLEQRATEIGTLLALGFSPRQVRKLLLVEGVALALAGGMLGALGGIGYAKGMLWGLTTIWRSAVGASDLHFHATAATLAIGFCASTVVAVLTIWLTLRKQARQPAAALLAGEIESPKSEVRSPKSEVQSRAAWVAQLSNLLYRRFPIGRRSNEPAGLELGGALGKGERQPRKPSGRYSPAMAGEICATWAATPAWWVAMAAGLGAVAIVGWMVAKGDTANAGAFFGAGALLLVAGLAAASGWLAALERRSPTRRDPACPDRAGSETGAPITLWGLAVRGCARRRKRSLATMALLACGSFVIAAIGVFRLDANQDAARRSSGTGGFALIGQATLPVVQDLNSQSGREAFGLNAADLAGVDFVPFRVREGDEASCLNLNRAQKPRLLGVMPELLAGRFTFAKVMGGGDRRKGWELLKPETRNPKPERSPKSEIRSPKEEQSPESKGSRQSDATVRNSDFGLRPSFGLRTSDFGLSEVPAIGDANSIEWALGKKIGDTIDYTDEHGRTFKLRLVGAVANSILQGSLIIDEGEFVKRFPSASGYQMFLVDAPSNAVARVSATLSRALQDTGLEVTPTVRRLNEFNAVQNTYLGTFQILGGLGLLLGSAGLGVVVLRNVLERRGELGLLLAVGFRRRALQWLVLSEHGALLGLGLGLGLAAAAVAVLPALLSPATELPYGSLTLTLGAVLLNGAVWTWLATRFALRGNLLQALRNE